MFLAWLTGFVVMFLLSGLWYMGIMGDYYNEQFAEVNRAAPMMLWIVLGYLVASFLLAYIYPIGYKGGAPAKEGLRFGLFMGLVMSLPVGLILYGVNTIPLSGTLVDTIYQVVEKTIGGLVIGIVYGSSAKTTSK